MVSIIIPIYNVVPYLKQCLDSVVNQTYKDIEIILVEDCSTDNPFPIIESYSDERITLLRNEQNLGLAPSRNRGMEIAKGEWLFFLDSDDYLELDAIQTLVDSIQDDCEIIAMNYRAVTDENDNDCVFRKDRINFLRADRTEECIYQHDYKRTSTVVWGKLYKRDFLIRNNIWFIRENVTYEDISFNSKCFFHNPKYKQIAKIGINYRIRKSSITGKDDFKGEKVNKENYAKILDDIEAYQKSTRF